MGLLDVLRLSAFATDDLGVDRVTARFFVDRAATAVATQVEDVVPPALKLQQPFELDLAPLALSNADHVVHVELVARDNRGNNSAASTSSELRILPDHTAPVATLFEPVPGSVTYAGDQLTLKFRAVDDTRLKSVELKNGATSLGIKTFDAAQAEGSFSFTVPSNSSAVTLTLLARDH